MKNDILFCLLFIKARLLNEDRGGYAASFNDTYNSFVKYTGKTSGIKFEDISTEWLKSYHVWMLKSGKHDGVPASPSTVGIYLRNLRTAYNEAIELGIVDKKLYPFKDKKYSIPSSRNNKRALSSLELSRILAYQPETESLKRAINLWKLSYFCNGMNFTDLLSLKRSDFKGNKFSFVRKKTVRNKIEIENIYVSAGPEAMEIFNSMQKLSGDMYILPYLKPGMTEKEMDDRVAVVTNTTNRDLKKIAQILEIKTGLSTIYARHSFSTTLMRKDVPLPFISKALGHSSIATTQKYLGDFENVSVEKYMSHLSL